jgi:hypothetical protein
VEAAIPADLRALAEKASFPRADWYAGPVEGGLLQMRCPNEGPNDRKPCPPGNCTCFRLLG